MNADDLPPELRNCRVRFDHFLTLLPPHKRHEVALEIVSASLMGLPREEVIAFRNVLLEDPAAYPFFDGATRAAIAELAEGRIALLDIASVGEE